MLFKNEAAGRMTAFFFFADGLFFFFMMAASFFSHYFFAGRITDSFSLSIRQRMRVHPYLNRHSYSRFKQLLLFVHEIFARMVLYVCV